MKIYIWSTYTNFLLRSCIWKCYPQIVQNVGHFGRASMCELIGSFCVDQCCESMILPGVHFNIKIHLYQYRNFCSINCGDKINGSGQCKKDVSPLLMHWSYVFLALTPQDDLTISTMRLYVLVKHGLVISMMNRFLLHIVTVFTWTCVFSRNMWQYCCIYHTLKGIRLKWSKHCSQFYQLQIQFTFILTHCGLLVS